MFLEAVTVCVNYPDFLSAVIGHNLAQLDHWIIVTDTRDTLTKELVEFYNVGDKITLVVTDKFYDNGAVFNKGAGVAAGLRHRRGKTSGCWMLHLDGDIWLPPHLRHLLNRRPLDPHTLYGLDRLACTSYADWQKFLLKPQPLNRRNCLATPLPFPVMSRISHYDSGEGYFPTGFFQLWNPAVSGVTTYPTNSTGADRTDAQFAQQFKCVHRHLLPDTFCIHLDSEPATEGTNWWGRRTAPFLPAGLWPELQANLPTNLPPLDELMARSSALAQQDFEG